MELAGQKARDVMAQVREEARTTGIPFSGIIIGSDTVVSVDDEILGKPADRDEALEMIGRIQGRSHRVYTGVAILTEDRESCLAVETRVDVYPMSDAEIEAYVDCGESMDKAGAYGIQGKGGSFVTRYEGDFDNVIGLCVKSLEDILIRKFDVKLKPRVRTWQWKQK